MIELRCGDCLDLMRKIPDKSIDLVLTDPPYFHIAGGGGVFGTRGRTTFRKDVAQFAKGFDINATLKEIIRVSRGMNAYFFCSRLQLPTYINYAMNNKLNWTLLTWHKTNPIPACGNSYLPDTEYIFFMRDKGVPVYGSYETKKTYFITPINQREKKLYGHPTIKPVDILKRLIINSSIDGATVLDPFMGTGSTGVACRESGRNFIGFEINPEYFTIAEKRIHPRQNNQLEQLTFDF